MRHTIRKAFPNMIYLYLGPVHVVLRPRWPPISIHRLTWHTYRDIKRATKYMLGNEHRKEPPQ